MTDSVLFTADSGDFKAMFPVDFKLYVLCSDFCSKDFTIVQTGSVTPPWERSVAVNKVPYYIK